MTVAIKWHIVGMYSHRRLPGSTLHAKTRPNGIVSWFLWVIKTHSSEAINGTFINLIVCNRDTIKIQPLNIFEYYNIMINIIF